MIRPPALERPTYATLELKGWWFITKECSVFLCGRVRMFQRQNLLEYRSLMTHCATLLLRRTSSPWIKPLTHSLGEPKSLLHFKQITSADTPRTFLKSSTSVTWSNTKIVSCLRVVSWRKDPANENDVPSDFVSIRQYYASFRLRQKGQINEERGQSRNA